MNTRARCTGALIAALCLGACRDSSANSQSNTGSSGGAQATYTVRLHRPARVGQRVRAQHVGDTQESRDVRIAGQEPQSEAHTTHVEFDAVVQVLAVNRAAKATRLRYTVERFEATRDQRPTASFAAGTEIDVMLGAEAAQTTITVREVAVEEEIRKALDEVINLTVSEETDDAVFGTAVPRAVGATWSANVEPLRQKMSQGSLDIPADGITATVTLFGLVQREPGAPMLDVRGQATVARARLRQVPAGFTSMTLDLQMRMRSLISATDLDAPPAITEGSTDSNAHGEGTVNGAPVVIDVRAHSERRATFTVLP